MTRRRAVLAVGVALYALFSSPTPDTPGLVEFGVLALLAVAALPFKGGRKAPQREAWVWPFIALLAYGATVPLVIGVFAGHSGGDMLRDLIAFAALAVPLLYAPLFPARDPQSQLWLIGMLAGAGLVFSLRYLQTALTPMSGFGPDEGFLYLANSPLVAFAAAWLLLQASFFEAKFWRAVPMAVLSLLPILAMAGMMQRATLALLALAWLVLFAVTTIQKPRRAALLAACLAVLILLAWPMPVIVIAALYDKTLTVGWNARGAELEQLLAQSHGHPVKALFGAGWGALVKSPAVGDIWVRFSHALLSSLWWKTGWIGLVLGIAAIGTLVATATRRLRGDVAMLLALLLPLAPALFLYGSYKSFCFGLLLLGLACADWTRPRRG